MFWGIHASKRVHENVHILSKYYSLWSAKVVPTLIICHDEFCGSGLQRHFVHNILVNVEEAAVVQPLLGHGGTQVSELSP